MYKRGIVEELDADRHRARVRFPAQGDVLSPWLDVLVRATHGDRDYGLPPKGTQVAVMLDEHEESGCVLGALYSDADPPDVSDDKVRRITFADGCVIEYDQGAHRMSVELPAGGTLELAGAASPIALASKVADELAAIKTELQSIQSGAASHTHLAGALAAPPGGGPVTGMTGAPVSAPYTLGYEPSSVAAEKVKSA